MPNDDHENAQDKAQDKAREKALTWAALLGKWAEFARSAVALPDEGDGGLVKKAVPDIIALQSSPHALGAIDDHIIRECDGIKGFLKAEFEKMRASIRAQRSDDDAPTATSAQVPEIPLGELIESKRLGEGAFGVVYEGTYYGSKVAIKKLKGTTPLADLRQEADVHYRLDHPSIIKLYGASTVDVSSACLVLELAESSLDDSLHGPLARPPNNEVALWVAYQIACGLAYLHSMNVFHRDLKPKNVLCCRDGRLVLCDFGLAKVKRAAEAGAAATVGLVGTVAYMAPEVFENDPRRDYAKVDVFAFAVVLYELVTCRRPWAEFAPHAIIAAVGRGDRPAMSAAARKAHAKLLVVLEELLARRRAPPAGYRRGRQAPRTLLHGCFR